MQWRDLLQTDNACPRIYDFGYAFGIRSAHTEKYFRAAVTSHRRNDSTRQQNSRENGEREFEPRTSPAMIKTGHGLSRHDDFFFRYL